MKRLLLLVLLIVTVFQGFSQTKGISYQAVILSPQAQEIPGANAQGNILANSAVSIQFTVVNTQGTEEYQEQHSTHTDRYGMINLLIGTGTPTSSNYFADIFWNGTTKKLKVGIDFSAGSNFSPLSEQDLTYMPQPPTEEVTNEITNNSEAISTEETRAIQAEQSNAVGISTIQAEQTIQNTAIALNTSKTGITPEQASTISNTIGINTGDQDISGIAINATAILAEATTARAAEKANADAILAETTRSTAAETTNEGAISAIQAEQTIQNTAIALNTAKVGITVQQISDIEANNTKVGITAREASDITANNLKVSDINHLALSTTDNLTEGANLYYTEARVSTNINVVANTAKKGIPIGGNVGQVLTINSSSVSEWAEPSISTLFYKDSDGDGYGDMNNAIVALSAPIDYVGNNTDCDDTNADVNPGAEEIYTDDIDNNCNGVIGYIETVSAACESCNIGVGNYYHDENLRTGRECRFFESDPGAPWIYCGNEVFVDELITLGNNTGDNAVNSLYRGLVSYPGDQDLSGLEPIITTKNTAFNKNFGATAGTVLEGNTRTIPVGGTEGQVLKIVGGIPVWSDPIKPETFYKDDDGDGYGNIDKQIVIISSSSAVPSGYVGNNTDCNDNDSNVFDANEVWYLDADGDNYAVSTVTQCNFPGNGYTRTVMPLGDCNDNNAAINPDSIWYLDADGDNHGVSSIGQCDSPGIGYRLTVLSMNDCNDNDATVFDANEVWYLDADGDNHAASTVTQCNSPGVGYTATVMQIDDCDDNDSSVFDANEVWYLDADGDNHADSTVTQCNHPGVGYSATIMPVDDCNDNDATVFDANDVWYLDADGDNYAAATVTQCNSPGVNYTTTVMPLGDCNDNDNTVNPGIIEIFGEDGIDNDCDGQIDELEIGQIRAGGIVFYIAPTPTDLDGNGTLDKGLVCSLTNQSTGTLWYNGTYFATGATGTTIGTGMSNTTTIIAQQGAGSYAAILARNYTGGGFNDWFLPSKNELNQMSLNYERINTTATTNGGSSFGWYHWSSSEQDYQKAWEQTMSSGRQYNQYKGGGNLNVRAVRAF